MFQPSVRHLGVPQVQHSSLGQTFKVGQPDVRGRPWYDLATAIVEFDYPLEVNQSGIAH